MIRDCIKLAMKDILRVKSNIFIAVSIIISTIFISAALGFGDGIDQALTKTLLYDPSVFQVTIVEELTEDEITEIAAETVATTYRVSYLPKIFGITINNANIDLSNVAVCVFDDTHAFLLPGERKEQQTPSEDDIAQIKNNSICIEESFYKKLTNNADTIRVDYMNTKNESSSYSGELYIIPEGVNQLIQEPFAADIYIPSSLLKDEEFKTKFVTLEYEESNIMEAASIISDKYEHFISNTERWEGIKTESLMYDLMLGALTTLIAVAMILSVFSCCNLIYKKRTSFFGVLRAMGNSKHHVFLICLLQGLIISGVCSVIGVGLSVFFTEILKPIFTNTVLIEASPNLKNAVFEFNLSALPRVIIINLLSGTVSYAASISRLLRGSIIQAIVVKE